jgi:hypothetical protein
VDWFLLSEKYHKKCSAFSLGGVCAIYWLQIFLCVFFWPLLTCHSGAPCIQKNAQSILKFVCVCVCACVCVCVCVYVCVVGHTYTYLYYELFACKAGTLPLEPHLQFNTLKFWGKLRYGTFRTLKTCMTWYCISGWTFFSFWEPSFQLQMCGSYSHISPGTTHAPAHSLIIGSWEPPGSSLPIASVGFKSTWKEEDSLLPASTWPQHGLL